MSIAHSKTAYPGRRADRGSELVVLLARVFVAVVVLQAQHVLIVASPVYKQNAFRVYEPQNGAMKPPESVAMLDDRHASSNGASFLLACATPACASKLNVPAVLGLVGVWETGVQRGGLEFSGWHRDCRDLLLCCGLLLRVAPENAPTSPSPSPTVNPSTSSIRIVAPRLFCLHVFAATTHFLPMKHLCGSSQ